MEILVKRGSKSLQWGNFLGSSPDATRRRGFGGWGQQDADSQLIGGIKTAGAAPPPVVQSASGEDYKMANGSSGVRAFQCLLIFGNVVIMLCGIALTAECIFHVSDQHGLYPLLSAANNDDIFAAAWIGLFVGFCLFLLSIVGIFGIMKSAKNVILTYLILMIIVYIFEVASCITAATHRDFLVPNFFLKQMLQMYSNRNWQNQAQFRNFVDLTNAWNRIMLDNNCCGVNGPTDWIRYDSAFRSTHSDSDFPWPRQCCATDSFGLIRSEDGCKLGIDGFVYNQGCFEFISGPLNRHAWGVAWFGFAILCWTFFVLIGTMYYYAILKN